jgi:hypothetical protein
VLPLPQADPPCQRKVWGFDYRGRPPPTHGCPGPPGPERAPLLVAGEPGAFALCGAWARGGAIAGARPVRVAGQDADPFALLDEAVDVEDAHPEAFGGGWVGYLGYDLGRRLERLPPPPPRPAPLPAFALAFYDHVVRCDAGGRWWFEALWTPARAARAARGAVAVRRAARRAVRARAGSGLGARPRAVGHGSPPGGRRGLPRAHRRRRPVPGQPVPAPAGRVGRRSGGARGRRVGGPAPRPRRLPPGSLGRGGQRVARALPAPARPRGRDQADQGHDRAATRPRWPPPRRTARRT